MKPLLAPPPEPVSRGVRLTALLLALFVAGVYLALAEDAYRAAAYVGGAYVAAAAGLVIGAAIATGGRRFGVPVVWAMWVMNAAIAVVLFVTFLLSRTVGLPGYSPHDWPVIQVIALAAEAGYVALFAVALGQKRRASAAAPAEHADRLAA